MKEKIKIIMVSAWNSLIWVLFTSFFGLIQVWATMMISYIRTDKNYSFLTAIQEGDLLFFIMALVAAITIDFYFSENLNVSNKLIAFIFILTPILISVFSIILYSLFYIDKDIIELENF